MTYLRLGSTILNKGCAERKSLLPLILVLFKAWVLSTPVNSSGENPVAQRYHCWRCDNILVEDVLELQMKSVVCIGGAFMGRLRA
jgi:hypothetical protein